MFIRWINKFKKQITFLSGALLILALIANYTGYYEVRQFILVLATIIAGAPIFINAYQAAQ